MDSLTDEQKRRIEENRQKALAKRAAALAQKQQQPGHGGIATALNTNPSTISSSKPPIGHFPVPTATGKDKQVVYANRAPPPPAATTTNPNQPIKKVVTTSPASVPGGTCSLVARDRFVVNAPYHAQLIAVLKGVGGGKYDPTTKKWNFPISQHGNLMTAIMPLKSSITLGPLPNFILQLFKSSDQKKHDVDPSLLSRIDPQLVSSLFEFQKFGVCFGIRNNGRCLLADDMGLGKTIQALGIAHHYYDEWPLLIATPSSMRYAWKEAIWKWLPSVPAGSIAIMETSRDYFQGAKVVILSYDLLQRRSADFQKENYKVVIIDESHHLKNYKAARSKAALPIIQKANRAILLSGTPALSRPVELYTQLSSIDRNCVPAYQEYGQRYCNGKKTPWGWDFSGSSNMEELQVVLTETVMIRRMKSDVLSQLPAKRRKTIPLDLGLASAKSKGLEMTKSAFNQAKKSSMEKRGKLLEFYAETGRVKLEAAIYYVKDLIEQDKKFLCFAHHREVLDGVSKALDAMKVLYIRIDGNTSSEERHFLCDQFQFRDDIQVAVLSITAANCGITLTAAHLVLFLELFWNPGILTQAEDRAHRIGQEDSVLIEYLVAPGTADDILWPMISSKLDILNKAGLSKDNFREADVEVLKKKGRTDHDISNFFLTSPATAAAGGVVPSPEEQEIADLFSDEFEFEDGSPSLLGPPQNVLAPKNSNKP